MGQTTSLMARRASPSSVRPQTTATWQARRAGTTRNCPGAPYRDRASRQRLDRHPASHDAVEAEAVPGEEAHAYQCIRLHGTDIHREPPVVPESRSFVHVEFHVRTIGKYSPALSDPGQPEHVDDR